MNTSTFNILFFSSLFAYSISNSNCFAGEQHKTITWVKNNASPFYIHNKNQYPQGSFGDLTQKLIMDKLTDYKHIEIQMSLSRVNSSWLKGEELCFSTMIHNSTISGEINSIPNILYSPPGVITYPEFRDKISKNNVSLSLENLLKNDDLTLGKMAKRSYGETIDKIVANHKDTLNVFVRHGLEETQGVLKMLTRRRFNFTIDYIYTLNYFSNFTDTTTDLVFLEIEETAKAGILGAIGCTDSTWGKNVINDINAAIRELRNTPEYRKILQDWMTTPTDEKRYWQEYQDRIISFD